MLARAAFLAVLLAPALAAAGEIGLRDVKISAPLTAWDTGRARMYLESAATGCQLASKRSLDGEYPIAMQVTAAGKAKKLRIGGGKAMARCLRGWLPGVVWPSSPAGYSWTGVLRIGVTPGLGVMVLRFDASTALHRDTVRNVILARLEELPACARDALADGTSVAIDLKLRAETDGVPAAPVVTLSTYGPEGLPACLSAHLATLRFPASHTYTEVKMFFHLLQPTDSPPDGAVLMKSAEP